MTTQQPALPKYRSPNSQKWNDLPKKGEASTEEHKKEQNTLKEVLLSSLQMQNLIVLSGCGTSQGSVGGPSMGELWDKAIGKPPSEEAVKVAGIVKYDLKIAVPNIEEILSHCEAYLQIDKNEDVIAFVKKCKELIINECSTFLDSEKLGGHRTFVHRLSRRRVRDPRLKIFTTNYDLCFEKAAGDLGLVVVDGFSFTQPRYYDPRFFGYDIVRRSRISEDQGSYLEGVFQLYKLHGSVNWSRNPNGRIEENLKPSADNACLIYPARGKYQQSFLQPYLEAVSQYFAALREPNTCLIVAGFGFNDDHLSEPILSAISSNPHLRLIIVDYAAENLLSNKGNPSHYWSKFLKLSVQGEDVWFINASFEDFAEMIPDLKSLTPAEKLMKNIQIIAEGK